MSSDHSLTVCNVFWGNRLASQPHLPHDDLLDFTRFWPDKRTFIDLYQMTSDSEDLLYDTVKLLLTSNTLEPLEALLSEGLLKWDQTFPGNMSFAHLVCAINPGAVNRLLMNYNPERNGLWTSKDNKGRDPLSVCFSSEHRKTITKAVKGLNKKSKTPNVGLAVTQEVKDTIFTLANAPEGLYELSLLLQTYSLDVNNTKDDKGNTLLHLAVQGGLSCLPQLFYLINMCGGDIKNTCNDLKMTPACVSAKIGDEKITELLVCVFGASVNETDALLHWSLLHYAARYGHPQLIRILLERGANANQEDASKCIPSFLAQRYGHNDCYRILAKHIQDRIEGLAQKATEGMLVVKGLTESDICGITKDGFTLLMKAVIGNRPATVRDLLSFKCCPKDFRQMRVPDQSSLEDSTGLPTVPHHMEQSLKTAVTLAAENGFTEILRILLNSGADPTLEDSQKWLAIHYASDGGHKESVKAILSHPKGLTGLKLALSFAEANGRADIVSIIKSAIERRQKEVVTPTLFDIAVNGDKDKLYQLLENGDDVNPINELSEWPLYKAAAFGHLEVIKMLVQHGGTVVRHNSLNLSTPLHQASLGGHLELVEFLLTYCCPLKEDSAEANDSYLNINEKNEAGATPLELAMSHGHMKVVQLLLDSGAITTLPDSTGRLISCSNFGGIQFLLESHRKQMMDRIVKALKDQKSLKEFKLLWKNPSDFNLRDSRDDSVLMVAARYTKPDVVEFLLQSASQYTQEMRIAATPRQRPRKQYDYNSSFEESLHSDTPYGYVRRRESLDQMPRPKTVLSKKSVRGSRQFIKSYERPLRPGVGGLSTTEESSDDESFSEDDYIRLSKPVSRHPYASCPKGNDEIPSGHCTLSGLVCLSNGRDGTTALHRAVEGNQSKVIPLLLSADPKVANIQDKNGRTALHLACHLNHKECVVALFNYRGIPINTTLRDASNKLPEELAIKPRLKNRVKKYREKQLKETHPAKRPLPPEPTTPTTPQRKSPGYTPSPSHYKSSNHLKGASNGRRTRRPLTYVPEDSSPPPPPPPPPSYGLTMEEDMRQPVVIPEYGPPGSVYNPNGSAAGTVYGAGPRGGASVYGPAGSVYGAGGRGGASVYGPAGSVYGAGPHGGASVYGPAGSVYGAGPRGGASVYGPAGGQYGGSMYGDGASVYGAGGRGGASVYGPAGSVYGGAHGSVYGPGPRGGGSVYGGAGVYGPAGSVYGGAHNGAYGPAVGVNARGRPHHVIPNGRNRDYDTDDPGYNSVSPPNNPHRHRSPTSSMERVAILRDIAPFDDENT